MQVARIAVLALLAWQVPATGASQEPEIVVRGDIARIEIERILGADNVDTSKLSPRTVANLIAQIPRRRAPEDFWNAYLAHVQAWRRLADATEASRQSRVTEEIEALAGAAEAIDATFDEVERIARRYGAKLPLPARERLPTV